MSRSKGHRHRKGSRGAGGVVALGSLTHVGMTRPSNQDAYCAILAPNAPLGVDAFLAVADGMGGHQAGEVASTMAIRGLVQHLSSQGASDATPVTEPGLPTRLAEVMQQVNAEVHQAAAQPETRGMGSTLTVALLAGPSLTVGHVGDSRVYLLRNGRLQQLTRDHSWVAEEVRRGALTPEAARTHRRRNILTRAVGAGPRVEVDTSITEVEEGDTIMLCSDGLHSLVTDEEITGVLTGQPPSSAAQALVDRANALGGNDNITVIVARVNSLEKETPATRQRKGPGEAKSRFIGTKTVELKRRTEAQRPGKVPIHRDKGQRLLLRLALLPIWLLKLLARIVWAALRLLAARRR